jgi:deazaflavin-dependent oxidoreductase (nitroreductase family)
VPVPPRSLKIANRAIIWLQRRGLPIGTMHLLTVRGRKSGQPRTTPVSPLTVDGARYIIGGYAQGDWVKNARLAGEAVLSRGKRQEHVRLVELPEEDRVPVLRAFPVEVPHGVAMFVRTGVVPDPTPDGFAAAAPRVAVFRIENLIERSGGDA